MTDTDPELSCMHRLRNWVIWIDGIITIQIKNNKLKNIINICVDESES